MLDWADLTLFLYITARMNGFVLFNPIFGRNNVPNTVRGSMALVFSVLVYSVTEQSVGIPTAIVELFVRFFLELLLGFVLGMVMHFFFYIPQLAGQMMDLQMGMTMNQMYDAGSQSNLSVTSQILNVLMILLFFAANGHHTLMRILLTSGDIVPFGQAVLGADVANAMLELFISCTLVGIKLCMPILAAELIGQLGMGILMKVIPQINVFSINIELKVIIGFGLLWMFLSPFSEFLLEAEHEMLNSLSRMLPLMRGM